MSIQDGGSDDLIGSVVQERYRVLSRIGQGGMGVVYEVEHVLIGRRLALKRLDPLLARNPDVLMRFQREARAAAAIGDEHIVEVSDMGRLQDGSPYIVMELMEGSDLGHELEKNGPLPISRAVRIAKECCSALGAAHAKGIIHRDVKPDNIFLTTVRDNPDFVKILDFGISKLTEAALGIGDSSMTKTGTAMGTPYYMSPEQVRGERSLDARTDVYAMGVVLFQMLSGRVPFDAASYPALVIKIVSEPPPSLLSLRTDIPASLDQVVQKAMAKEPADRFGSMEEFADALSSFSTLSGRPQLTEAGVAFTRTSTPQAWESPAREETVAGISRGPTARTWAMLGGAAVASVLISYLIVGPRMTGQGTEEPGTAAANLLAPALPETPATTSPGPSAEPGPLSPPVAASRSVDETSAEPSPVRAGSEKEKAIAKKDPIDKPPVKTSSGAARKKRRSTANESEASSAKKPARRTSTASKQVAPTSVPAAKPSPATREVVLKSQHRAAVTVELKCGDKTSSTRVAAKGQATVTISAKDCRVTCSGLGSPSCPVALRASAGSMIIH